MLEDLIVVEPESLSDAAERVSLRERLRRLRARLPRFARWAGGERFRVELPAVAASVAAHVMILALLGSVGYAVHKDAAGTFRGTTADANETPDFTKLEAVQELDQPEEASLTPKSGSFSTLPVAALLKPESGSPAVALASEAKVNLPALDVRRATEAVVPSAAMFSQSVAIKGDGAEHVGTAEGAVDRLADEILRRLEKGRTLVVWAFDASGSLQGERERLAKHIDSVYAHIGQLDSAGLSGGDGLLTSVVAFGQDRRAMTDAPTADRASIASAIREVPLDDTGVESTFSTVADVVRKWGRYKDKAGNRYHTMVIVVTDEVGDDEDHLEEAIEVANGAKVPVYVLGSQAIFARSEGRMNYKDPKTGHVFYNLPVRQGPESLMPEQVRLPFWYGGDQYDLLDSGFGPYALSRLAGATGGIYFVTRLNDRRVGFDPVAMREYKPDWLSRSRYESEVMGRPVRKAVIEASIITQEQKLPGMPSLTFPAAGGPEFKEAMENNQALTARVEYTVDAALEPITAASKSRDRETSRRWQAHYDLIRGRLLAVKVRCHGYNLACAQMKKDAPKFTKEDSNAWRLVASGEVPGGDKAAAAAKQATDLLKKVVEEHPGTPWALLAQRELKDPLGFKWVEVHVKPVARMNNDTPEQAAKKKQAQMNNPKPPEPPKL